MRILQVNSAQNLGGGETHVIELSERLRNLGHAVLVAGRSSGPLNPDITLAFRNSTDFLSALRLRKILRDQEINVVHAHLARDYPVVAAAAWHLPDLKVIFTRHLLYPVKSHPLYRRVDGWLAPTSEILETLRVFKPKRSAVIPNWVDTSRFRFRNYDLHSPVIIGMLGRISPHKGHDDAIEALRILGSDFRLIVAGQGDAKYIETLRTRVRDIRIDFVGFVSSPDFLQTIDLLIVPSWHEPFGIVLLEAMSAGVPVISTSCGGPRDIIRSGEDGLLVPAQAPGELANAIRLIAGSAAMRLKMIRQARARVESEFNSNKVVPRIERFYTEK